METSLYQFSFKDGRVFRVFCANKKQNRDILHFIFLHQKEIKRGGQVVLAVGIHTMSQFNKIFNSK